MSPQFADDLFVKLRQRNSVESKPKMLRDIDHIKRSLSHDDLLRVAYIPFVIARLVWDYTDTILNLCYMMRLKPVKRLCTAVRKLRREYDQERAPFIDRVQEDGEEENMLVYESQVKHITSLFIVNLDCAINREFSQIPDDFRNLLKAVYQTSSLINALILYTEKQTDKASAALGWPMSHMLPIQIYKLRSLLPQFAGDLALGPEWQKTEEQFVKTFANQISAIDFRNTRFP